MTRDSWGLVLVIIASIAGYFATLPPPLEWTWAQWMNFVVFVAGLIATKLSGSGLASSTTPKEDTKTILGGLFTVYAPKE